MSASLLTVATAGSIDDGKSTLIGRLLYESGSLSVDRLEQIESASRRAGHDGLDLSLVADGLIAEREQGITIDVAHLYFSSNQCDYIIADSPGHFEYTRNMVTGVSRADVMVMLIDARHGVKEQSLRHLYLAGLLRLRHVVVAVNKMDLVEWSELRFNRIVAELQAHCRHFGFQGLRLYGIPVSSLRGENFSAPSSHMPWFRGLPLLDLLDRLAESWRPEPAPLRFVVQGSIRPRNLSHQDYRGIAGRVYGASLEIGKEVVLLPSGLRAHVSDIQYAGSSHHSAAAGSSCTILLDRQLDAARGNLLALPGEEPPLREEVLATVCQFAYRPLQAGQRYLLQAGALRCQVRVLAVESCLRQDFSGFDADAGALRMNDIGTVRLQPELPLHLDTYAQSRHTGSFILIDESSGDTCAVGLVVDD